MKIVRSAANDAIAGLEREAKSFAKRVAS